MDKYIFQILENNSRVIVPEFGAFIVKQRSPLTIVFNEFLQYNDGMLVDTVSKGEGTGRDEAKKKIDDFVKSINEKLSKGESFPVSGLGILVKSNTGKISLELEPDGAAPDEKNKAPEKTPAPPKETPKTGTEEKKAADKTDKKTQETAKTIKEPEKPVSDKPKTETRAAEKKDSQQRKDTPDSSSESKTAAVGAGTTKKTEPEKKPAEDIRKKPIPEKPLHANQPKTATGQPSGSSTAVRSDSRPTGSHTGVSHTSADSDRKATPSERGSKSGRKRNVWLWVIIIVLVNAGIVGIFYSQGFFDGLFTSQPEEEILPLIEESNETVEDAAPEEMEPMIEEFTDEPVEEQSAEAAQSRPPVSQPVQPSRTKFNGKRYYVVAGVFSIESNADGLVDELIRKGYDAEKFGKIGNLHAVSFGVFSNSSDANAFLAKMRTKENPDAWIKVVE